MSKQYKVRLEKLAQISLKKMDQNDAKIIMSWISKNLVNCEDPYVHGKSLQGDFKGKWRYRVGNYRLIANINNDNIIILILVIGHRREIYK
nr:type II toxin-antitoxin system RelE/ParE family toxin [Tissierella sp.]